MVENPICNSSGHLELSQKNEFQKPITFFFISGLGGANHGIQPIKEALQTIDGGVNTEAIVWNSVLSSDPRTPKRWTKMTEQINQIFQEGRKVVFIVHSGGAGELAKVFDKMKKKNPELLSEENLSNIEVILIGPAGFLNARKTVRRLYRLQASQLGLPRVPKDATATAGIESLYIFPHQTLESGELSIRLREMFPDLINMNDALPTIEYIDDERHWELTTDEEKNRISQLDEDITLALERQDKDWLEKLLKERAKLLNTVGIKAYDALDSKEQDKWEQKGIAAIAYLGLFRLLRKFLFKGVKKDLRELEHRGLRVSWIVPEYDMFVLLRDVQQVYELPLDQLLEKIHVVTLERATHAGWAPLPNQLAQAVSKIISS
jgi:hypothetical protein